MTLSSVVISKGKVKEGYTQLLFVYFRHWLTPGPPSDSGQQLYAETQTWGDTQTTPERGGQTRL
jgi:hypothetical protein